MWECNSCGVIDSRRCNGDNSICVECGTPDYFTEIEEESDMGDFFHYDKQPYKNCKGLHRFGDKLGEKV